MYWMDNELQARTHYKHLLQEAERERQALQIRDIKQRLPQRNAVYQFASLLRQLGRRLERFGAPHTANS
jgi:hypothetical protein